MTGFVDTYYNVLEVRKMKIDMNYKFENLDGSSIPEGPDETEIVDGVAVVKKKSPPFTLKTACINVLIRTQRDPQTRAKEIDAEEKIKRYELAKKIYKSLGLVDLQSEEITLLKKLVGQAYPPLTVGQAFEVLDPHSEKK